VSVTVGMGVSRSVFVGRTVSVGGTFVAVTLICTDGPQLEINKPITKKPNVIIRCFMFKSLLCYQGYPVLQRVQVGVEVMENMDADSI